MQRSLLRKKIIGPITHSEYANRTQPKPATSS